MPLGIQQNNDFTQFTMDVWNDKIFYQEKEFPAGFMAMSILNIPEEELPELIQAGGAPTFLFPVVVQGSDEEAAAVCAFSASVTLPPDQGVPRGAVRFGGFRYFRQQRKEEDFVVAAGLGRQISEIFCQTKGEKFSLAALAAIRSVLP